MIPSVHAAGNQNASLLYGWNGTTWTPLKVSSDGTLNTDLNLTESIGINPKTNATFDLGSIGTEWQNYYGVSGLFSKNVSIGSRMSRQTLDVAGGHIAIDQDKLLILNGSTTTEYISFDSANRRIRFNVRNVDGYGFAFTNNSGTALLFVNASGNVGIGTTGPGEKLSVAGADDSVVFSIGSPLDNLNNWTGMYIGDSVSIRKSGIFFQRTDNWNRGDLMFAVDNTADASDVTTSDVVMTLDQTGNVGIGTTGPNALLHIAGSNSANNLSLNVSNFTVNSSGAIAWGGGPKIVSSNNTGGVWESFRGLYLRTDPNTGTAENITTLVRAGEIVMDDGTRVPDWGVLTANMSVSGAGGLDTGSEAASAWYEIYAIRNSTGGQKNLLLHRAYDYYLDQNSDSVNTAQGLRTDSNRERLAQGIQVGTAGKVESVDLPILRTGTPSGRVWITIEADSGGSPSGTPLATSDKLAVDSMSTATAGWKRFVFRSPATLATSTQYHIVLYGDYTTSGTNYVNWYDTGGTGYSSGGPARYNGATWTALSPANDFNFKVYVTREAAVHGPVTLPSGYDQKAKIGYVYNNANKNFVPFVAKDRRVTPLVSQEIVNGLSTTAATLTSLSAFVPPGLVDVWTLGESATSGTEAYVGPVPDGYGTINTKRVGGATGSGYYGVGAISPHLYVSTEMQAVYLRVSANTANIFFVGWEW